MDARPLKPPSRVACSGRPRAFPRALGRLVLASSRARAKDMPESVALLLAGAGVQAG